jgi:uncharacterized iron-regulated membrane protein
MACLLIAAVTGTWLVFRVELDRWVNPHLRVVRPQGTRASLASIVDTVERRFPDALVRTLILPERADEALGVYVGPKGGADLEADQIFVNPYTGAILGQRSTSRIVLTREHLDPLIDRLHYSLLMNAWGLWLMGIVAGIWLLTTPIGLALAWPGARRRIAGWAGMLSARMDRGAYQGAYQAHRALGVWFMPVLLLLAFTSVYQNLPQFVRPIVNAVSTLSTPPPGRRAEAAAPMISPDQALARLVERLPSAQPSSIGRDLRNGRYAVLFRLPGDLSPLGDNWAFVDLSSGDVTALKLNATSSAGDRFLTWIFPLHTGTAFGLPGRIVIAATGVALVVSLATGFYVWGVKWRMRRQARRSPRGHRGVAVART